MSITFKKELLYFCLPFLLAIIGYYALKLLELDSITIAFYDAVFIIPATYIIIALVIIFGISIYLMRAFWLKFTNKTCNYISLIYIVLMILLMSVILYFHDKLSVGEGWAIYPPLSELPQKMEANHFIAKPMYLMAMQLLLIILLAYTGFKAGKNSKTLY